MRFGHPSVHTLRKQLTDAGHETKKGALELMKKLCHIFQMKADGPKRFDFSIKDDTNFIRAFLVNVIHLQDTNNSGYVLHVADLATSFQTARIQGKTSSARS